MSKCVYVVVLNWNGWQDTIACLVSLQQLNYADFNLLVVDNGSTDSSVAQIKRALPEVELLQTGVNLGFGGGCNAGIKLAMSRGADYVWLLNSDATVDPGALSAMVRVAEQNLAVGAVGSVLYEADQPDQRQLWGGGTVNLWLGRSKHRLLPGPLDYISGASALLRCSALDEIGSFDQSIFFMYWEDTDLSFRLRHAGWLLAVAEDSRVWHKQSASLGKRSPVLDEYFVQSAVRFFGRYAPMPVIALASLISMMLFKRVATGEVNRVRAVLKGFLGA